MIQYLALFIVLQISPQQKAQQKKIKPSTKNAVVHYKHHIACNKLPILEQMKYCMSKQEVEHMFRIIEYYEKHNYPDRLRKLPQHGDSIR
jgi:hypothetical protein